MLDKEMVIAVALVEKIYKGVPCTIENIAKNGVITMSNGTQWLYDEKEKMVRMVVD